MVRFLGQCADNKPRTSAFVVYTLAHEFCYAILLYVNIERRANNFLERRMVLGVCVL